MTPFQYLFLLACAALPDETAERLDLPSYYEQNRWYFWTLFALVALSSISVNSLAAVGSGPAPPLPSAVANLLTGGLMLSLAFVRNRAYHSGGILLLLAVMALGWWQLGLQ